MDDLTLLRKVRDEPTGPSDTALMKGRTRLAERLAWEAHSEAVDRAATARRASTPSPTSRTHTRMRRVGWISGAGLAAAGLVVALVVGDVVGLAGWRGGADAAAAGTLDEAAAAAIKNSDPVVGPGQYLEIATHAAYAAYTQAPDGTETGYLASQDGQVYVPADESQVWTWVRDPAKPVQTFGPESAAAAAAEADSTPGEFLRAKAGAFYGSPADPSPASIAALPRNPRQLLNHIYRTTLGQGRSGDGEALVWIADTLRSGIVPAAVRASLYRAAALIPGVTLTPGAADLDGRTGVAIGRDEIDGTRQEIIIDPDTGLLIGEREVLLKGDGALPTGTSMGWTSVTTSVVDRAPSAPAKASTTRRK
ncbi:CU044_5270 family protein [Frondihabitans peucedani]|uniref:CU044_5270 family protein n=1 Tax=Frondihabitans peucedani TaxID=598626 RepID=A0ABP8E714_9MICO